MPGNLLAQFIRTQVNMDFGAGAAGACLPHHPEVIFRTTVQNLILGEIAPPQSGSLFIRRKVQSNIALMYSRIQSIFGKFPAVYQ